MMSFSNDSELARFDNLVSEAERLIARQRELLGRMPSASHELADARKTLELMIVLLDSCKRLRVSARRSWKRRLH